MRVPPLFGDDQVSVLLLQDVYALRGCFLHYTNLGLGELEIEVLSQCTLALN